MPPESMLQECVDRIAEREDADVLFYSGPIDAGDLNLVLDELKGQTRNNLVLFLTTYGGDPNEAYRIARTLVRRYERFTTCIGGFCKSAGTLVCVGSHQLVMGPRGELGPLDMQLAKQDEIVDMESGLVGKEALSVLSREAYQAFLNHLIQMKVQAQVSTRFAASIAKDLTIGLFGGLYSQLDPVRLGELERNCVLAVEYGDRLATHGQNLNPNGMKRLAGAYPSHGFVIDREEAETIFQRVRSANEDEANLVELLEMYRPHKRAFVRLAVGREAKKDAKKGTTGRSTNGARKNAKAQQQRRTQPGGAKASTRKGVAKK